MRIVYFGTAEFAVAPLKALLDSADFEVVSVVAKPDMPVGRKMLMTACPVAEFARQRGVTVLTPEKIRDENFLSQLAALKADVFVVAAYGKILPKSILEMPSIAIVNLHGSILPKYRGASPIQTAILNGDDETGVSLMDVDEEMDHGSVYDVAKISIAVTDTYDTLSERLAKAGAELLLKSLPLIASGKLKPQEQDHAAATYCTTIKKEDGEIKWNEQTAEEIRRRRNAFTPWPGIFTRWQGKKLSLLEVEAAEDGTPTPGLVIRTESGYPQVGTKDGQLILRKILLEGKKPQDGKEFLNGYADLVGSQLGN